MELEGYSRPTCSKQPRLVDCRIGVVNKLDRRRRRRVLLTMRSTYRGEIFQVRSSGQSPRGKYPNFWRYQYFLITEGGLGGRTPPCQKQLDSSGCFDTIPACDRRTDRRTRDDSIHSASIASRGENCFDTKGQFSASVSSYAIFLSFNRRTTMAERNSQRI